MPKFLITEKYAEFMDLNDVYERVFFINGKDSKHIRKKLCKNWKTYFPTEYDYTIKSITGGEEWFLSHFGCSTCEFCDHDQGTCFHKCVKDKKYWDDVATRYFENNQELIKIYKEIKSGNIENIQKIVDFIFNKKTCTGTFEMINRMLIVPVTKIKSYK